MIELQEKSPDTFNYVYFECHSSLLPSYPCCPPSHPSVRYPPTPANLLHRRKKSEVRIRWIGISNFSCTRKEYLVKMHHLAHDVLKEADSWCISEVCLSFPDNEVAPVAIHKDEQPHRRLDYTLETRQKIRILSLSWI